jgi:hypothetical protein
MTASPRIRSSTSFLRSGIRRRIERVRRQTGTAKVGKADVLQHVETDQSTGTRATSSSTVVKHLPGNTAVIPVSQRRKQPKNTRQLPLLLMSAIQRVNPLDC